MRIAVVGGGVAGLVSAYLLQRNHEVTVFEANGYVGGHTNTIDVTVADTTYSIDTGFIVYNEKNYPGFTRLLENLGVRTQPSTMSFSVRADGSRLEYNGSTIRQLFTQRRNLVRPSFYRMVLDILRFNREAPTAIENGAAHSTLGDYLHDNAYSPPFVDHYLVPMGSALWSVPRSRVFQMPAPFFVRFFQNHGMLTIKDRPEWRVIAGGSARYVEALTQTFADRVRLNHAVRSIRRTEGGVTVDGERFDHVVLACHSDQALDILADPTPPETEILGALPYQKNDVVLHTDTSMLPIRRPAWAAWNYRVGGDPEAPATVTYNMNILQSLEASETFCVSLNSSETIDPSRVLYRTTYDHPTYSPAGADAQRRHHEISGADRTHYCGAYWGNGFHEDGVQSALTVAKHFGEAQ